MVENYKNIIKKIKYQIKYMENLIKSIKIISKKFLCGPNMWNYTSSLEVLIDIGEFENYPSNKIPNLYNNLIKVLPSLYYHRCSYNEYGGFLERMKEGTYLGHILEHITLELQNYTYINGGTGRTRGTEISGVYKIIIRSLSENKIVIEECFDCALELLLLAVQNKPIDLKIYMRRIHNLSNYYYGYNTYQIIKEIPKEISYFKIENDSNFIQLGYGSKLKYLWTTETNYTKGIAESIVQNKYLTKKLLQNQGIPVANGNMVSCLDDAYILAENIGFPIVIKPVNGSRVHGVTLNILNKSQIKKAFNYAVENNKYNEKNIIIEKYIKGIHHKITVINNKVVGCCKCYIKKVYTTLIGDGNSSIKDLLDDIKAKNILIDMYLESKTDVIINDIYYYFDKTNYYLKKNGYTIESILPLNYKFTIIQEYDSYIDCLELIHDKIKEMCCLATRICKLDVCGIDIITTDISKDLKITDGVFLELNAGPALGLYRNSKKSVPQELINYVCQDYSKLPILNICGDDSSFVNNFISSFFIFIKMYVGSYGINGYKLNNILKSNKTNFHWENVKQILMNRMVEIAIFDTTCDIILNEGLFYNYCNSIILDDSSKLENILRVNVDIIRKDNCAILNYDDKNINKLIKLCDGSIIFFTVNGNINQSFKYRTVSFENNNIILYNNESSKKLITITEKLDIKDKYNLVASIGGIWSCYDLFNDENINIFKHFIN